MVTCNADNKHLIDANSKEDHTLSKKMDGDEGLNTVSCLRGRLLAERQASRIAKEEVESMETKLVELEKLLREEIKLRDKAERKLKFLKKKLESFNTCSKSGRLEHCDSNSCGSSSICSDSKHSESNEAKNDVKNPAMKENIVQNHYVSAHIQSSTCSTKDCDSQITDDNSSRNSDLVYSTSQDLSQNPDPCSEDLKNDESRVPCSSSKSSVTENNESENADFYDNSLALVPVSVTATTSSQVTSYPKPVNESVLEALDALKRARESLQSSIGTRQMIHVGPI